MTAQTKHRILIIGDSHVRCFTEDLVSTWDTFSITGYVILNTNLDIIMTTAKSE